MHKYTSASRQMADNEAEHSSLQGMIPGFGAGCTHHLEQKFTYFAMSLNVFEILSAFIKTRNCICIPTIQ